MATTRRPGKKQTAKGRLSAPALKTSTVSKARKEPFTIQPAPGKRVLITDVALRDGHQSLLATRMRTEDMLPIAQKLDAVGYWSLEVWGGATFDTCLRFLKEDPWERLRALRVAMPNTKLQMLLRGQNLVGYRHYADDVLERFIERSASNGIDVFRIFDALNDVRNLDRAVREVKACGKHAEATISYTVSPVHSIDRFVDMAKKLEDLGAAPYNGMQYQKQFARFTYPQAMSGMGKLAAIPADIGPGTLLYRQDLIERAGIKPD